jgi:dTDP-glucose 4,6-dehydratase
VIVRPTNNYGIGQYVEKLIPKTVKALSLGNKIELHDHGKPRRTWLHVEDTARAVMHIIKSGTVNEIYNISGNFETENIDVVTRIVQQIHRTDDVESYIKNIKRAGQDVRYSIDDTKLKHLGWNCASNFDTELHNTVEFYMNNFIW